MVYLKSSSISTSTLNTIRHDTIWYNTTQYDKIQHDTTRHDTIQSSYGNSFCASTATVDFQYFREYKTDCSVKQLKAYIANSAHANMYWYITWTWLVRNTKVLLMIDRWEVFGLKDCTMISFTEMNSEMNRSAQQAIFEILTRNFHWHEIHSFTNTKFCYKMIPNEVKPKKRSSVWLMCLKQNFSFCSKVLCQSL